MKKIIAFIIILTVFVSNIAVFAENTEIEAAEQIALTADIMGDNEISLTKAPEIPEIPVMSHEEAKLREAKMQNFKNGINLMSLDDEGDYSEVVYIETIEDLKAIDGHVGGYYELQNDIDLAGEEWSTIALYEATFNGNGYAIKNMKITEGTNRVVEIEVKGEKYEMPLYDTSFITGSGTYIIDLKLTDFVIDVDITMKADDYISQLIAPLGNTYAKNCVLNGKIDVFITKLTYDWYGKIVGIYSGDNCSFNGNINYTVNNIDEIANSEDAASVWGVEGLNATTNSTFDGNITAEYAEVIGICYDYFREKGDCIYGGNTFKGNVNVKYGSVRGISDSTDNTFMGNITAEGIKNESNFMFGIAEGINRGNNNTFIGDLKSDFSYGIIGTDDDFSKNCRFVGDIFSNYYAYGIVRAENCTFDGSIISGNDDNWWMHGISSSENCILNGDISSSGDIYGIDTSLGCILNGNISGAGGVCAINESNNSMVIGDIYKDVGRVDSNRLYVIYKGTDNYVEGHIYGKNITSGSTVIYGGANNTITGCIDIITQNTTWFYVFDGGNNNTVNGDITFNALDNYGHVWIANNSVNCIVNGNITTNGEDGWGEAASISGSVNCIVNGNITATSCRSVVGLSNSTGYISGTLSATNKLSGTVTSSASKPYEGLYRCEYCEYQCISSYNEIYCYNHYDSNGLVDPKICARMIVSQYSNGSVGIIPPAEGEPEVSPEPILPPTPDDNNTSYSLKVIYTDTEEPVAGAVIDADGKKYTTDESGVAVLHQGRYINGLSVTKDDTILHTETGYVAVSGAMNTVKVHGLHLEPEDFNFGNSGTQNITGPSFTLRGQTSPIFDLPFSIDANVLDVVKMAYDADEKTWKVLLGTSKELENLKDKGDANDEGFRELYEEYTDLFGEVVMGNTNDAAFFAKNNTKNSGLEFSAYGFLEIKGDESLEIVDGGVVISGGIGINGSMPVPSAPIVYFAYGAEGNLSASMQWLLKKADYIDPEYDFTGEAKLATALNAGVGVGAKKVVSLEIGLEGNADFTMTAPFLSFKENFKAELSASFYALLNVLGYEWKQSQKFAKLEIYPTLQGENMAMLMSIDDGTPVSRDYLNEIALFGNDSFKQGVYPYTDVQTVTLSDGRVIMVWLDDNPERDDANRTSLYYSILENGVWSSATEINGDNTSDFSFSLSASGNKAVILWQDIKKEMTASDDINTVTKNTELCYAEFNGSSWSEPILVTENGNYEYAPSVYTNGTTSYIAWVTNDIDSPVAGIDTSSETVYKAAISNGTVSDVTATMQTSELISEIAAGNNYTAVVTEKKLYINGNLTDNGEISSVKFDGNNFIYNKADKMCKLYTSSNNIQNLCTSGNNAVFADSTTIVSEVQDGFNSELYASYLKNGVWSAPVKITDFGKKIRSWSAYKLPDGTLSVAAALADIAIDGEDISQYVTLTHSFATPVRDIVLEAVEAENISRGETAEFTLYVTNNTGGSLFVLDVNISGGEVLYEGSENVYIDNGETAEVTVRAKIPDTFEKQEITATISSASEENGIDNNSKNIEIGSADAEVKLKITKSSGTAKMTVTNNGCEDIANAKLVLKNGSEIFSETISLAAGESKVIKTDISDYLVFDDNRLIFSAEIQTKDEIQYNNKSVCTVYKEESVILISDVSDVILIQGENIKPNISGSETLYAVSSDENVATVSEDGTITAIGGGEAVISYMSADAINAAKVNVLVREKIEINDIWYADGYLNIDVSTLKSLGSDENVTMIIAAYDEGKLLSVQTCAAVQSESIIEKIPLENKQKVTVKVMIWNNLNNMKPLLPAEETMYYFTE